MPRIKKEKINYFDVEQEEAVVAFLDTNDEKERNLIYNKSLKGPLNTMVESIIRTYGLHRKGIDFRELHNDTLSYLILKSDRFVPERNKKAYSYYGTICKNHILGLLKEDTRTLKRNLDYDDYKSLLEEDDRNSYTIDDDGNPLDDFIQDIKTEIIEELNRNEEGLLSKKMSDNEKKVGLALIKILNDWETIFLESSDKKYNKNSFYYSIREYTGLKTKDIRNSMNRFKKLYFIMKNGLIS